MYDKFFDKDCNNYDRITSTLRKFQLAMKESFSKGDDYVHVSLNKPEYVLIENFLYFMRKTALMDDHFKSGEAREIYGVRDDKNDIT